MTHSRRIMLHGRFKKCVCLACLGSWKCHFVSLLHVTLVTWHDHKHKLQHILYVEVFYNIRQYRPKDWQIFASRHGVTSQKSLPIFNNNAVRTSNLTCNVVKIYVKNSLWLRQKSVPRDSDIFSAVLVSNQSSFYLSHVRSFSHCFPLE